ncbi:MAG TPA: hypothetical protein K8V11_08010 [Dietzia timorensis]|jgi:hypothetical protein|uniref:3-methyladenine DNA glycosylase n=1 Tax=Dietzia timorensis TaxID=499555 RepID=A0A921F496_9ACTN|nr:hypothetical protein [Dietzia timorensis]HJE90937.1 hypothetical protein [Dietzia timorensis]
MAPITAETGARASRLRLTLDDWRSREAEHHAAVDELTSAHLRRSHAGIKHPIIDFLFTYYRSSVGALRTWHPGTGVQLEIENCRRGIPRFYRRVEAAEPDGVSAMEVDFDAVAASKGKRWQRAATIVARTASRPPRFGCFGRHEWAMVYRLRPHEIRHEQVPLRVSEETIAEQVEAGVHCTHFDAFRFFTAPAEPLNEFALNRDSQLEREQPGCLHAGMDLYRWASELGPACPSDLLLDTFRASLRARVVDMQASPYDLRDYGYEPIKIETPHGRAQYAAFQRRWAEETNVLRERMLALYASLGVYPE